jgi:hypothetical protein
VSAKRAATREAGPHGTDRNGRSEAVVRDVLELLAEAVIADVLPSYGRFPSRIQPKPAAPRRAR